MSSFKVHLESNIAQQGSSIIRLEPQEAEFLYVLNRTAGKSVARRDIMKGLYGPVAHQFNSNVIKKLACNCRQKIAPLGMTIEPGCENGYRLVGLGS